MVAAEFPALVARRMASTDHPVLTIWTIYARPRDRPDVYVVRGWDIPGDSPGVPRPRDDVREAVSLDDARALVPPGLSRIPRSAGDDPVIVESWL